MQSKSIVVTPHYGRRHETVMFIDGHPKQIDARRQAKTFYQFVDCGQAVARILKLLKSGYPEKSCDVVLLDEWDANLDKIAQADQDKLIDDLAQSKCIIEVLRNSRQTRGIDSPRQPLKNGTPMELGA